MKYENITVYADDAALIKSALHRRLAEVIDVLDLMKIAADRDLTPAEWSCVPADAMTDVKSSADLAALWQDWDRLRRQYTYLIEEFSFA